MAQNSDQDDPGTGSLETISYHHQICSVVGTSINVALEDVDVTESFKTFVCPINLKSIILACPGHGKNTNTHHSLVKSW